MSKLTKKELIDAVQSNLRNTASDLTKSDIDNVLTALGEAITSSLNNEDSVVLPNVGSFEKKVRAARKGRNPQTGAEIEIAAANVCGFKAVKALKDALNG